MTEENLFNPNVGFHCDCIRFCFIGLLQSELDETINLWNNHRIRHNYYSVCPSGRPDTLFYAPEMFGGLECKKQVSIEDIPFAEEQQDTPENVFGCSPEFIELSQILMSEGQMKMPTDIESGRNLFSYLVDRINML